jgi:hypothetical protein
VPLLLELLLEIFGGIVEFHGEYFGHQKANSKSNEGNGKTRKSFIPAVCFLAIILLLIAFLAWIFWG